MSSGVSGCSTNTRTRDSSAPLISNDGFSVVAPISVIVPRLDVRQKRVLLRLVEAMDLVGEQNRSRARSRAALLGLGDDLAHARHAFGHRGERDELAIGVAAR